jgi:lon-related putative ATP-dependent protease
MEVNIMVKELTGEQLRKICDPSVINCETSEEVNTLSTIVGQERALRALQFGLGIKETGFNIYVAGLPGTGRTTAVERFLEEAAKQEATPSDWCYVNNFHDAYKPNAMRLPAGMANDLKKDMEKLIQEGYKQIRAAFESEEYANQRDETVKSFQEQKQAILEKINQQALDKGFTLQATPMGLMTIPVRKGKPISEDEFMSLSTEEREELRSRQQIIQTALEAALRQSRGLDKNAQEALQELDQKVAQYAIGHLFKELLEKYQDLEEICTYLEEVQKDILANIDDFKGNQDEQATPMLPGIAVRKSTQRKYEVNVLVDNSDCKGAPVILEMNPTYNNLFGRIEQEAQFGALTTDFTLIRRGSLHHANGGYLVLPIEEMLRNPLSWDSLKRALENTEISIEDLGERIGFITTKSLRPEPIPLEVKVVLIGRPDVYQLMLAYDEQFNELFKVKADVDVVMPRNADRINEYIGFASTLCNTEKLLHLDSSALAKIVEHGSRLAEDQDKLSTHFGEISDVIREASYYAREEKASLVSAKHISKAIDERFYRSSLVRERIQEMITRDIIKINIDGEQVGQVNGLSVIQLGDMSFGQPSRITVSVGLGSEGLIDIEREADLSGPIHTKGVLILSGYLAGQYSKDKPLSLAARLVFEQSYSGIDGDSASSTELYAILSALAELPIKQGIAVTGSVNQKGEVQAIGGVNEKIEGFFEICKIKGLTGEQGVMIPESNVVNLMLREAVVEAVKTGKFHIWPVKSIDEGIELLTGVKAGAKLTDGTFEEGSVHTRVDMRLKELADKLNEFGKDKKDDEKGD